jgi:hypothetical protein
MSDQAVNKEIVDTRQYRHSIRLRFEYDGKSLRLVGKKRLQMIAPASPVPRPKVGTQGGFWVELQSAEGQTVFHRLIYNPLRTKVEVHSPDRQPKIITGPPVPGTFSVLVPDIPKAKIAIVFGPPLDPGKAKAAGDHTQELMRFDLNDREDGGS